ncbi:MAG: hypothetical protein FJ257_10830 [Phycisphaerae bacterium]|nr:hypothetical protein [Phycisphaerae bacterium]
MVPSEIDWKKLLKTAGPYPLEAFQFVQQGLGHTVERVETYGGLAEGQGRHVSGQQLCLGLRDFAIQQYGLLAPTVLRSWNVVRTDDFGRIVFAMIEHGLMSKTSDDSLEDFRGVYDFAEAFDREQILRQVRAS